MDIEKIISEMTLEEKAAFVSGEDMWTTKDMSRLGVPPIFMSDGPHGLRKQNKSVKENGEDEYNTIEAVCFPTACATSASFDKDLMYRMGVDLGKECQAEDVSTILGPAINIKRSPLCGRNFEYVSEDPYLAGEMSASYINGVQSQDVGVSLKHFAANSQETERMYADSLIDERTLREIYLAGFETAVKKSAPWTLMCSYNRINGEYSSENNWLLNKVLRDEWGFDGVVMSDWGAVSDRIKGIASGLDLEMPGSHGVNDAMIVEAVKSGKLSQEKLDIAVRNILKWAEKFLEHRHEEVFDRDVEHEKAVRYEEECIVLLKNEAVLPLSAEEKVLIVGGFADKPRFQGGGSSHIEAHNIVSAVSVKDNYSSEIKYIEGFPSDKDEITDESIAEIIAASKEADKVVVFAGLPDSFESEGYDRDHMRMPESQNKLIAALAEEGTKVIVVLHNGSPIELPWAGDVSGIVEAYLGGEGVGEAVMNVLYGKVNPSGKLAESFPIKLEDNPSFLNFPVANHKVHYGEGVFVGYRYYDTKKMDVLFPFGFGLSYTEFEYSNLKIGDTPDSDKPVVDINEGVTVTVDITNTGKVAGKEIVQLYVRDCTNVTNRPVHELKGFEKIELQPGETGTVSFTLDKRSFAWYSTDLSDWYAANGKYVIEIGASSRDIRLEKEIELSGSFQLPPRIDQDVQLGELFEYGPTREFALECFAKASSQFTSEGNPEVMEEMAAAMLKYTPIRTLRSFGGMPNEAIAQVLEELKKLVK